MVMIKEAGIIRTANVMQRHRINIHKTKNKTINLYLFQYDKFEMKAEKYVIYSKTKNHTIGGRNFMYHTILQAIVSKLEANFQEIPVYLDGTIEEKAKPCFFVEIVEASCKRLLMGRFLLKVPICIQYVSEQPLSIECHAIAEHLAYQLEVITLEDGSQIRGTQIKHNVSNDSLNFFILYQFHTDKKEEDKSYMEQLKVQENKKQ